jgi:maleylpyruvate isomerase
MLDAVTQHHADDGPFTVRAIDLGREWTVGEGGGPVVSGSGADLGWWLTGRGSGATLAVEGGDLPRLGPWRAAPTRDRR